MRSQLDSQENIAREQLVRLNEVKLTNKSIFDSIETQWSLIEDHQSEGRTYGSFPSLLNSRV